MDLENNNKSAAYLLLSTSIHVYSCGNTCSGFMISKKLYRLGSIIQNRTIIIEYAIKSLLHFIQIEVSRILINHNLSDNESGYGSRVTAWR